jgi:cytochrome c peroxidase
MSCASCHDQARAFTDGQAVSKGVTGEVGTRSAMSLANVAYLPVLSWQNPQLTSLEVQALIPLFGEHPVEMGLAGREQQLFAMFKSDATYRRLFAQAFPAEAGQGEAALYSLSTLTKALASFQRSLLSFDSPYDRYRYGGQKSALGAAAKRGEELFFGEKLECYHCHGGFNFTDNLKHARTPFPEVGFHNTGLYNEDGKGAYPKSSPGIVEFTGEPRDAGRFRTPSLRNVAVTAPYMHDGSIATLSDVLRTHYARAGRAVHAGRAANPLRSEFIAGFEISETEIADVVAFLESLTDERFLNEPRHRSPWQPTMDSAPTFQPLTKIQR